MAAEQSPGISAAEAESKLQEALARMKAATDRHAAVVAALSRLSATPQEKRFAQSESRKVERELRDAKRILLEAKALTREAAPRA